MPHDRRPDLRTARSWACPRCGTSYVWSKRMIGRESREGWERMTYQSPRARLTGSDEQFDRWFGRAALFAVLTWLVCTAGFVALIVWIVLRVTS